MGYAERRGNEWRARFKLPNGKYDSEPGFRTKEQALKYARDQETDIRRGDYFDATAGSETTFGEWAAEWIAGCGVGPGSEETYAKLLRVHLRPQWAEVPMAEITTSAYLAWERQIKGDYSKNYAKQILGLFRVMVTDAIAHRPPLLKVSPVPPENRRRGQHRRVVEEDAVVGTLEQVLALAENALTVWGPTGYVYTLTKAFMGLRQGEMAGLRREWCYPAWPWSDPGDSEASTRAERAADRKRQRLARERYTDMPAMRVHWQLQYVRPAPGERRAPTLVAPKYGSRRDLVIPPFLAGLISEMLETHDSEWVFPALGGRSLLEADFSGTYWEPMVLGAPERTGRRYARPEIPPVDGIEEMVPHGLRHGMKVWLDEDGIHSRVAVEARMGHQLQGVEAVYSQVTPAMELKLSRSLQERWEKATRR
jgi:integrase